MELSLLQAPGRGMSDAVTAYQEFLERLAVRRPRVLEIGVGDGFGLPIVAQAVGHVHALDWEPRLLEGNARRLGHLAHVTYLHHDLNASAPALEVDAAYSVDVIEHIDPAGEAKFLGHVVRCLTPSGVLLTGTPNVTAKAYASPPSQAAHVNLKSMDALR